MITPLGISKRIKTLRREALTNDEAVRNVYLDAIAKLEKIKIDREEPPVVPSKR